MAAPTISTTTSILQYLQFAEWEFQPVAANNPTGWNCTPLPDGMDFDPATGLISGAALQPGVYVVQITATNSDGTSSALEIAIGIQASNGAAEIDSIDLNWDMGTGLVTPASGGAIGAPPVLNDGTTAPLSPVAWLKSGDIRMIHITPMKNGVVLPIVFTGLVLNVKEDDGDGIIATSVAFVQVSTGENNLYRIAIDLTSSANQAGVGSALSDHYADAGSQMVALAELEATYSSDYLTPTMDGGPSTLITSSQDFGLGIEEEIAAVA